eukprot:CAMPEP_0183307922 /NCGR_PEP_ID=MMETSP0160_2-20130417/19639_1 /TAXON_ID=2839 ORGANISM="Odontella Sinensis, Strain Grunow 1884" /NCGR_SAMPLE_ID=MMETSP0160_2 /ASSEMBLY_ACC=CAM_ASM_000250 /LENGTH=82 /DNA_ID=CAMNT_0025471643 /DNA_START=68 /DNA_END=316 /DNA_ORIENTATION=-
MALRQILSKAFFPSLERDMQRAVGKEVIAMEDTSCMAPSVYSYVRESGPAVGGAFGRTARREAPVKLVRVEKPVQTRGLFFE